MSGGVGRFQWEWAQNAPVAPTPVWTSSTMRRVLCLRVRARRDWKKAGEAWLSPPSDSGGGWRCVSGEVVDEVRLGFQVGGERAKKGVTLTDRFYDNGSDWVMEILYQILGNLEAPSFFCRVLPGMFLQGVFQLRKRRRRPVESGDVQLVDGLAPRGG